MSCYGVNNTSVPKGGSEGFFEPPFVTFGIIVADV